VTVPFHVGVVEVAGSWVPLYLVCLAGAVREAGFDPYIYDAMTKKVGFEEIGKKIEELKPAFLCVSTITCTFPDALKVAALAKEIEPAIKVIFGGVHSSFMYEEVFQRSPHVDFVVRGEGEHTIVELLQCLQNSGDLSKVQGIAYRENGKVFTTKPRPLINDLDQTSFAWDLLDWQDYTYYILPGSRLGAIDSSRGCEQQCTFCSQQKYWQRHWRARSPERLIQELEILRDKFSVDVLLLTDDYPTPDRKRWERFLELLIERDLQIKILMETRASDIVRDRDILDKYYQAGIIHIYVGTEATNQESLDYIKKEISIEESRLALKLLKDIGIITETSMILGFPDETWDSIRETLSLVIDYDPDFAHFLAIAPWPYSDIYEDLKPYIKVHDYRKYNLIDPIIEPKAMSLEEIDQAIVECYKAFYMNKYVQMLEDKNQFRKDYLFRAMKLMMANSFIKKKLGNIGGQMPEEIKTIINGATVEK